MLNGISLGINHLADAVTNSKWMIYWIRRRKLMYHVITIIVFFIGVLLCCVKAGKFNNCKLKIVKKIVEYLSDSELNGYLINTMVAFLGVTIAIIFANLNTAQQEKEQTIEFLEDVLCPELGIKATFVTTAMIGMDVDSFIKVEIGAEGIPNDEISVEIEQPFDPEKMFETMKIYPINPVVSLDIVLNDSPYKNTISRYSYSALIDCRMNFIAQKARIDSSDSIEEMVKILSKMSSDFDRAYKIVEIELEYQNKKISEDDVHDEIDKLYDELRENEDSFVIG